MKTIITSLMVCAGSLACIQSDVNICNVQISQWIDGDTFHINLIEPGRALFTQNMPIRIMGIDAPEMHSPKKCEVVAAKVSRDFLKKILSSAKHVDLLSVSRDKYFRIDATVMADDKDVGKLMIAAGMAVPYDGGTKHKFICKKVK